MRAAPPRRIPPRLLVALALAAGAGGGCDADPEVGDPAGRGFCIPSLLGHSVGQREGEGPDLGAREGMREDYGYFRDGNVIREE